MAEEVLEYGGSYWTLSGQRLPYMRDKTRDDNYFILTLFAIAKEFERSNCQAAFEQVDLAVGLPPEHYGMQEAPQPSELSEAQSSSFFLTPAWNSKSSTPSALSHALSL